MVQSNEERNKKRRERYALNKQIDAENLLNQQQRFSEMGTEIRVLKQFIDETGTPMEIVFVPFIGTTMLRRQAISI